MSKPQKGLGRGLGALLGDMEETAGAPNKLRIQYVEPNPKQPRKEFKDEELEELANSIAQHGIIQPIAVREGARPGFYEIISGERRWRAARKAGLDEVPVHIIPNVDDRTMMELALIENLQREDLTPIEEAQGYKVLMEEYDLTQEQVAEEVGKSRPAVTNAIRLLLLPPELQDMLRDGVLSAGHCRALLPLQNKAKQLQAAQKIIALRLSVRQAEALCKNMLKDKEEEIVKEPEGFKVDYIAECEKTMAGKLGRRVKIINGKRKGRFEIEFYGDDDLQVLLDQLQNVSRV